MDFRVGEEVELIKTRGQGGVVVYGQLGDRATYIGDGVFQFWNGPPQSNIAQDCFRRPIDIKLSTDHEVEGEVPRGQVGGSHYQMPIEPIDFIVKNELGYREGNVVKYVCRHKKKNGAEDVRKAIHYLEMILEDYDNAD